MDKNNKRHLQIRDEITMMLAKAFGARGQSSSVGLTVTDAMIALMDGKKITHPLFYSHEYLVLDNDIIVDQDGVPSAWALDPKFDTDGEWEIYKSK